MVPQDRIWYRLDDRNKVVPGLDLSGEGHTLSQTLRATYILRRDVVSTRLRALRLYGLECELLGLPIYVYVQTVFLGIDYGAGWSSFPLVFESCAFANPSRDDEDTYRIRYSAYNQAMEGHAHILGGYYENHWWTYIDMWPRRDKGKISVGAGRQPLEEIFGGPCGK
jgi:hypothetical protein